MLRIMLWIIILTKTSNVLSSLSELPEQKEQNHFHLHESSSRLGYNLTNLIYEYYLVCGPNYICNRQHYSFINVTESAIDLGICPKCKCDWLCGVFGDCCTDVLLSMPQSECVTTSIVHKDKTKTKHYIIADCHNKSLEELNEKCVKNYTDIELMKYPPVMSSKYAFSYRNRFCAECNGVYNYSEWVLDMACPGFADINFLSSYEDILETALLKKCVLEYKTEYHEITICDDISWPPPTTEDEHIERCNVTGTWISYDRDIELACSSNYLPYHTIYGNMFCFLCNPPDYLVQQDLIDTCNVSGIWSPYDMSIEQSCRELDRTAGTQPYKNVFCFLCNRNNTNMHNYFDVESYVKEKRTNTSYEYSIYVTRFNEQLYQSVLENSKTVPIISKMHEPILSLKEAWNSTKLLTYHFALDGPSLYCNSDHEFKLFGAFNCSCDLKSCLLRDEPPFCCFDLLLEAPTTCFSDILFKSDSVDTSVHEKYGAINDCVQQTPFIQQDESHARCKIETDDVFGKIPVTYNKAVYKNFDCFWCNLETAEKEELFYTPWTVIIECVSNSLNINFHVTLNDVIKAAKQLDCAVRIHPERLDDDIHQMSRLYCGSGMGDLLINRCNITGLWTDYDPDIESACEDQEKLLPSYLIYKNAFCYLCNNPSSFSGNDSIDRCLLPTEAQYHGEGIIELCKTLPMVPGFEPYKNKLCYLCSSSLPPIPWQPFLLGGSGNNDPIAKSPTMRELFSGFVEEPHISVPADTRMFTFTNDQELYNTAKNKSRRLVCYPGKTITDQMCKPLLKRTSNLRYIVAFSLEGNVTLETSTLYLFENIINMAKEHIVKSIKHVSFDSFHIKVNRSCEGNVSYETLGLKFLVHTVIFITQYVDRRITEEIFLNMTNSTFRFGNSTFQSNMNPDAFVLPAIVDAFSFIDHCYSKTIGKASFSPQNDYQPSLVSPLLLCRQVELEKGEYKMEKSTFEIVLSSSGRKLQRDKFMPINDKVRICLEDFQDIFNTSTDRRSSESPLSAPLKITTLVCTVISLVSLFVTFATYCLFPVMRSLPGMNNMSLVFAMFFAQLLFECGYYVTSEPTLCMILGIFIHIFWLSTFGCMNVCSYHMYSVFAGDLMEGRLSHLLWKKRLLLYILYSYGLPSCIVLFNILIVYTTSQDRKIGYGETRCFLNNIISFYLTFLAPVLIICFSNVYFFIRTAIQIKNSPKVESTKEKRNQYVIYVKLFSVTGITWILLVVDTLFPVSVFSFLVTIATACQGLFVLASFVLNRRVLSYYYVLIAGKKRHDSPVPKSQEGTFQTTQATSL